MGIQVEFNPDLALRKHGTEGRESDECLPAKLEAGDIHRFMKKGQRNYWLEGEIPLLITKDGKLSKPIASIRIVNATHYLQGKEVYTRGLYKVVEFFDDNKIHFKGFARIR